MFEIKSTQENRFAEIKFNGEVIRIPVRKMGASLALRLSDLNDRQSAIGKEQGNLRPIVREYLDNGENVPAEIAQKANELSRAVMRNQIEMYKACIIEYEKYEYIIDAIGMNEIAHIGFFTEIIKGMHSERDDDGKIAVKKNTIRSSRRRKKK